MTRQLTAMAILLAAGCGQSPDKQASTKAPAAAPVPVTAGRVERAAIGSSYEATGTVRARTTAMVAAKIMGYATEVRARAGDHVAAGQTLVVLDARDQQAGIQRAEAAREEVRAALPEADGAIAAAQSQLDLAKATHARMQDLFNKRSATNQEFDEASARLKAAAAALEVARARRKQLDSRLQQVEQEVRAAGIQRTYTEVAAPFAGVILTRSIEPGVLAVPGAPLFTMEQQEGPGALRFEANVEESRLRSIRVGQPVKVSVGEWLDQVNLRVAEIVPTVDPASRTGIVKMDLPPRAGLRSGMFGKAEFAAGSREALTVPVTAVIERGQLQSVFVIDGNVARLRLVTLGEAGRERVEVLSGLHEGERVAASVPAGLLDGARLEVRP